MNEEKKNKKNKKNFKNYQLSDICAKYIIEKLFSNIKAELCKTKLDNLVPSLCISYAIKELKTATQEFFMCREIDPIFIKNNPQIYYDQKYTDNEPINEVEIMQPKSAVLDRWKICQIPIVKMNNLSTKTIEEAVNEEENNKRKKTIKYSKFKRYKLLHLKKKEEEENKNKKNEIIDLPCYPIDDLENENKSKSLIYKGNKKILDYQELNQYYLEKINLEEEKKQKEINKQLNYINSIKKIKEPKKIYERYKGKKINIDHNGEIVLIKEIKIENLQADFVGLNSKLNEKYKKMISRKSIKIPKIKTDKEDKNEKDIKIEYNISKRNKEIFNFEGKGGRIIAGSSFNHFYPEVGVKIKEGNDQKNGGIDFYNKYKKYDMTKFNNTMISINNYQKENYNNSAEDFNIISNNDVKSSIINEQISINNNQSLNKTMYKNMSFPNINSNTNIKNIIKEEISSNNKNKTINKKNNSMNIGIYHPVFFNESFLIQNEIEDNYIKYGKFIKATDSFSQFMLKNDENEIMKDKYINKTNEHFLNTTQDKLQRKIDGYNHKSKKNYDEINDFNKTIVKDNNWGKVALINKSQFNNTYNWYKNRFNSNYKTIFNNRNPYTRLRKKKKMIHNSVNIFNYYNTKRNFSENDFVLKFMNKSNDK